MRTRPVLFALRVQGTNQQTEWVEVELRRSGAIDSIFIDGEPVNLAMNVKTFFEQWLGKEKSAERFAENERLADEKIARWGNG